jgi:hypothetical protein
VIPQPGRERVARTLGLLALGLALLGAGACSERSPASPSGTNEQPTVKFTSASFRFLADRVDADTLGYMASLVEPDRARFMSDLQVDTLPVVSVYVWQDEASFYADMQARAGQVWAGAGGWVPGRYTVSVLARGPTAGTARAIAHEVAHVISMAVNPTIVNSPRWLWETVALYEARELVNPATLDYMRSGHYPSLADLDVPYGSANTRQVYEVGYVLGQFIVSTWGFEGLVRLIRANGNLLSALGLSPAAFESRWHAFLHAEYGLPEP